MKKKILFIEDNEALQRTVGDTLRAEGYDTLQALDGDIGLRLAKNEKPDLILLDLVLPEKNGLDVLTDLSEDPALKAIPVIVLTNKEEPEEIQKVLSLGARTYLVKINYALGDVIAKVKEAIGE